MSDRLAIRLDAALGEEDKRSASEASVPTSSPLLSILDRLGCGAVVLDGSGNALQLNSTAQRLLERETGPARSDGPAWTRSAIKQLLGRATTRLPADTEAWVTVPCESRLLALYRMPVSTDEPGMRTVLVLLDLDGAPQPSPMMLRRMFGLTAAEASLARQIVGGKSPSEIAQNNHVSMATVRSQLASVFSKTATRGQSELVALLGRVSILP